MIYFSVRLAEHSTVTPVCLHRFPEVWSGFLVRALAEDDFAAFWVLKSCTIVLFKKSTSEPDELC